MRMLVMIESCILALATCTAFAQGPSAPPTRVRQTGVYACPTHPQIQATWPAQCPTCQTVLSLVRASAAPRAGMAPQPPATPRTGMAPMAGRDGRMPMRPNEELREQGRRNEEFREQARRNEERRERFRRFGYGYPLWGYPYQYPNSGYYYNPYGGYYYNPYGGYYFNPYGGYYYYNPNYGYYYYWNPGYYYPNYGW